MIGVVRKIVAEKGFGFIRAADKDYFFHKSDYTDSWDDLVSDYNLDRSVDVEFEIGNSIKGPRANMITRL